MVLELMVILAMAVGAVLVVVRRAPQGAAVSLVLATTALFLVLATVRSDPAAASDLLASVVSGLRQ